MKDLLEYIVKSIVDKPDEVKTEESANELGDVVLKLSVAEEDMGKVIGREGKIIKALRTIIRIVAIKNGKRVLIELEEKGERSALQKKEKERAKTEQTDQGDLSEQNQKPPEAS